MALKIIHTADVHLGSKLAYLGEKAAEQRQQVRRTFEKVITTTLEKQADLFLLAGDLFDSPFASKENVNFVITQLERLIAAGVTVAVVPGNHDRLEQGSVYGSGEFQKFVPERFHLFTKPAIEAWHIASLDCTVYGAAILEQKSKISPLQQFKKLEQGKYHIGLFHGSVDLQAMPESHPLPKELLEKSALNYIALGDWHSFFEVPLKNVKAFYSGSPELIAIDQQGAGNIILVTLDESKVNVEKIAVGKRSVVKLEADLGKYADPAALKKELDKYADPEKYLELKLTGIKKLDFDLDMSVFQEELLQKFFFARVQDNSHLELSEAELSKYPEELISGRFLKYMQQLKAEDLEQQQIIDEAIQLGLHLLKENP